MKNFSKSKLPLTMIIVVAATIVTVGMVVKYLKLWQPPENLSQNSQTTTPTINVTANGRLVPSGEVINLSASPSIEGAKIKQLEVEEGDRVEAGELIAILDSSDRLEATLHQAQAEVKLAQAKRDQVKAGASQGEIQAQQAIITRLKLELNTATAAFQATIVRLQAELDNAQKEYQRYESLYKAGAIAASERDTKELKVKTTQAILQETVAQSDRTLGALGEQIQEAIATLNDIKEVRPEDVKVAQAELERAMSTVNKAKADLEVALVRSPQAGKILKIYARPGEVIDDEGILILAKTEQMEVVAEVYQTDIPQIYLGQKVTITSEVFPEELQGEVIRIGSQITRQNIFESESGADIDRRIVEVRIALNSAASSKVQDFTNLQVIVYFVP